MEDDKLILELEDGTTIDTLIEGYFDFDGRSYIVLSDENEELYIYRVVNETNNSFEIQEITSELEMERVSEELDKILSDK